MTAENDINFLKSRGVKEFVHFTRVRSLGSIFQHGLMTRDQMLAENVDFQYNDENRFDGIKHSNLSISFPNFDLFYAKRRSTNEKWCVLSLSLDVLKRVEYQFSSDNAAANRTQKGVLVQKLFEGFRYPHLPRNFTTNNQSELLVFDTIPMDFLNTIYLEENNSLSEMSIKNQFAKSLVKNAAINFDIQHDDKYFNKHPGYSDKLVTNFDGEKRVSTGKLFSDAAMQSGIPAKDLKQYFRSGQNWDGVMQDVYVLGGSIDFDELKKIYGEDLDAAARKILENDNRDIDVNN